VRRTRLWGLGALGAVLLLAVAAVGLRTADGPDAAGPGARARSVILVVGDGMGAAHREAARLALSGNGEPLGMDRLPVLGLQTTDPVDPEDAVTDSAAAATAWATGSKTVNGTVSVDADGDPLLPLGVEAAQAGKATGIVTTSLVTDATPAAFFSTVEDRKDQSAVASQLLDRARPGVVLGGGEDYWLPEDDPGTHPDSTPEDPDEGSRGREDLLSAAREQGYEVVGDRDGLESAGDGKLLGLFANEEMWQPADEREGDVYDPPVSLAAMTRAALDRLDEDEDGFFLLVEEEAVDGMSHANNGTRMLQAMESLDAAVQVARDYVEDHPDTLLIVAGDHDAGGLAIEDFDDGDREDGPFEIAADGRRFTLDWTTEGHTGVPTPVTAQGPGAERLAGQYPNVHLHEVMRTALLGG
jgi:alkaline phosphatase